MPCFINLRGRKYGRLTVIYNVKKKKKYYWGCKCKCGNLTLVVGDSLRRGSTRSCGCLRNETTGRRSRIHGDAGRHRLYEIWVGMNKRCYNKNRKEYKNYGGRGIRVCNHWRRSFIQFKKDMGIPSMDASIERINNNGNYMPSNCKWATKYEQNTNKRTNKIIKFNGSKMCLSNWAKFIKINESTLLYRLKRGWSVKQALTQPVITNNQLFIGK